LCSLVRSLSLLTSYSVDTRVSRLVLTCKQHNEPQSTRQLTSTNSHLWRPEEHRCTCSSFPPVRLQLAQSHINDPPCIPRSLSPSIPPFPCAHHKPKEMPISQIQCGRAGHRRFPDFADAQQNSAGKTFLSSETAELFGALPSWLVLADDG